jgi:ADP-heptose:LPS heptosyltransferase
LAVRLDNAGDVLLTGPALRAVAGAGAEVTLWCGRHGAAAAQLLPGVAHVVVCSAPWVEFAPDPVDPAGVQGLVDRVAKGGYDEAIVFTSFHQSPLPTALLLQLAGVRTVSAISEDYPGALLTLRHRVDEDLHEVERNLSLVVSLTGSAPYVVMHPGVSVPARAWSPRRCAAAVDLLSEAGWRVVVTGAPAERGLTRFVAGSAGVDLGGRTGLAELAAVIAGADAVVVGNTGPAHLAAAVGTPVVSLFAPVVPAHRWRPYGVASVLLGDQDAPCRGTRARECPVAGHPCLDGVGPVAVLDAVDALVGVPA